MRLSGVAQEEAALCSRWLTPQVSFRNGHPVDLLLSRTTPTEVSGRNEKAYAFQTISD